jgi:vacuolar-type H+-ATPase subunit D/Vma8
MASAIAILDASYNCLISRTYKSTILDIEDVLKGFSTLVKLNDGRPVFQADEINYIFIQNNEITIVLVCISDRVNAMMLLSFLYRFNEVLMNYFRVKELNKDLIVDNVNLIYELFDEMMDFGMPQLTETSILKDVIKVDANLAGGSASELGDVDTSEEINSSILRSTTQAISWRPKGIFYKKNEFFLNVIEKVEIVFDLKRGKLIKYKITGEFDVRCYLSGMPVLRIGLNKLNTGNDEFINGLKFHQCVDLTKFNDDKIVEFTPPDGSFKLLNYSIDYTKRQVNPIIQITDFNYITSPQSDKQKSSFLRLKISIRTNFPKNSALSKLHIKIPISSNYLNQIDFKTIPKFKTTIGKVFYKFNEDCIIWTVNSGISGDRDLSMQSQFKLISEESDESSKRELSWDPPPKVLKPNFEKIKTLIGDSNDDDDDGSDSNGEIADDGKTNENIKVEFELPDCIISGLKVEYLKITENGLDYTSFPWIKYVCMNDDDYVYRI